MLLLLLSKEVRQHLMTFRFAAVLVTTFLLVLVSVWMLGDDYIRRRDAYNAAAERAAVENSEFRVPTQISPTTHRPPSPLSIFAEGEDRRLGNSLRVSRWEVPYEATGSFTDNVLLGALPPYDLLTIITVVISLFGLLISYNVISGEKEDGTLRLICTSRMRRGSIFTAKFLGAVLCIWLPVILSLICCLLVLNFIFRIDFTVAQWGAILAMGLTALLYSFLFIAFGMFISVLVRRSSTALVFALIVWALAVLMIPGAAQSASYLFAQPPSGTEITKLQQNIAKELRAKRRLFFESHDYAFSGWCSGGGSTGDYWMFDGRKRNMLETADYVRFFEPLAFDNAQKIWQVRSRHDEQRRKQASIAGILAFVSPAHQVQQAYTSLAGTDIRVYDEFLDAARRYREQMIAGFRNRGYLGENALQFFTRRTLAELEDEEVRKRYQEYNRLAEEDPDRYNQLGPDSWPPLPPELVPPFRFAAGEPDFEACLVPLVTLAAYTLLVFALGFVVFIRYDVR